MLMLLRKVKTIQSFVIIPEVKLGIKEKKKKGPPEPRENLANFWSVPFYHNDHCSNRCYNALTAL